MCMFDTLAGNTFDGLDRIVMDKNAEDITLQNTSLCQSGAL